LGAGLVVGGGVAVAIGTAAGGFEMGGLAAGCAKAKAVTDINPKG
jgi:hypothetical protein